MKGDSQWKKYKMITKRSDCMYEKYNVKPDKGNSSSVWLMAKKLTVSVTFTFSSAHPFCISHTFFISSLPS